MGFSNLQLSSTPGQCGCCPTGGTGTLVVRVVACLPADNAFNNTIAGTLQLHGPNGENLSVGPSLTTSLGGNATTVNNASAGTWTISLTATKFYSRTITADVSANTTTTATVTTQGKELLFIISASTECMLAACFGPTFPYTITGAGLSLSGTVGTGMYTTLQLRPAVADNLTFPVQVTCRIDPPGSTTFFQSFEGTSTWNCTDPYAGATSNVIVLMRTAETALHYTCVSSTFMPTVMQYTDGRGACDVTYSTETARWMGSYTLGPGATAAVTIELGPGRLCQYGTSTPLGGGNLGRYGTCTGDQSPCQCVNASGTVTQGTASLDGAVSASGTFPASGPCNAETWTVTGT